MRRIAAAALVIWSLAVPLAPGAQPGVEQRLQGAVLSTRVTLCELKPRGCAGYMIVQTDPTGGRERVTVQVRLGVPIREGETYVALATLDGRAVSVVYVNEKGRLIARSIEVLGKMAPSGDTEAER